MSASSAPPAQGGDSHRPRRTAAGDKLPLREKVSYGFGNQSMGMVNQIIDYQVQQVLVTASECLRPGGASSSVRGCGN